MKSFITYRLQSPKSSQLRLKDLTTDSGVSIVEIVISMLLLGLLAIAFLPFLVTSLKISVDNIATVAATEIVHDHSESLRHNAQDCTILEAHAASLDGTVVTQQGQELQISNTVTECGTTDGNATVRFFVEQNDETVLDFSTIILVDIE